MERAEVSGASLDPVHLTSLYPQWRLQCESQISGSSTEGSI